MRLGLVIIAASLFGCATAGDRDSGSGADAAPPGPCGNVPRCDGSVLVTCADGVEVQRDCEPDGQICRTGGGGASCVFPACEPSCGAKACGGDGCGGSCGTCTGADVCTSDGQCVPGECQPSCAGKACGDDGCGGSCGTCADGASCSAAQQCEPLAALALDAVVVVADDNTDGILSPGENGALSVALRNMGSLGLDDLQATLSTATPGVTVQDAVLHFGDLAAGASACGRTHTASAGYCSTSDYRQPRLLVDPATAPDTMVSLSLAIAGAAPVAFQLPLAAIDQAFIVDVATVVRDSNGDGVASPGEDAALSVALRNTGASDALGVTATLTTTMAGVTVSDAAPLYFDDIAAGTSACGRSHVASAGYCSTTDYRQPRLTLSTDVAVGALIPLTLAITDVHGNSFTASFEHPVVAIDQSFAVDALAVVADANGDGVVSPGEDARLSLRLHNSGASTATDVRATVTSATPGVAVVDAAPLHFGDIGGGASTCGRSHPGSAGYCSTTDYRQPGLSVATSVAVGTTVPLTLAITDAFGNAFTSAVDVSIEAIDQSFAVVAIDVIGDDDDQVAPGQSAALGIQLGNSGSSMALGVTGILSTTAPGAIITGADPLYFGDVAGGGTACGRNHAGSAGYCSTSDYRQAQVAIPADAVPGTTIPLSLTLTDVHGNAAHVDASLPIGP